MEANRVVSIIGHFGGKKNFLDGQTIKTKTLYEELSNATDWRIIKVDTYYKKKNPFKLIYNTLKGLIKSKDIIILLSKNGMKIFFPILYLCSKCFNKNIYHDVIGGNLDQYIIESPKYKKYLNEFRYNWVETEGLKNRIEKLGIKNCEIIPNFKRLNILSEAELRNDIAKEKNTYTFCTFSRVIKEKGIEEAIRTISELNKEKYNDYSYKLDIYGQIDLSYIDEFKKILETTDEHINYCDVIPFDKSVEVLKEYDALLFPTFWNGEGFPGTIIDAFSAGLPVIASNWNCNSEIIDDKVNGIIYPSKEIKSLKESICFFLKINKKIEMKKECIKKAKLYQPEMHIENIKKMISEK